jgi:hypothetical protein
MFFPMLQLTIYLIISIILYHSPWTFKFINIFSHHEYVFVLKPQSFLIQLKLDSTNIVCSSNIDKNLNWEKIMNIYH